MLIDTIERNKMGRFDFITNSCSFEQIEVQTALLNVLRDYIFFPRLCIIKKNNRNLDFYLNVIFMLIIEKETMHHQNKAER